MAAIGTSRTSSTRPYHERLVAAFVANHRVRDAAAAAGVSVRTALRWKAVSAWWAEVLAARRQVLGAALEHIAAQQAAASKNERHP